MEETIIFVCGWILMELIFWGFMYFTGYVLVPLISFGKLQPDTLSRLESGRVAKRQSGFMVFDREDKKYLGAWGVCAMGLIFWVAILVAIVVF